MTDSYANAFKLNTSDYTPNSGDNTDMNSLVYERKYEIDSVAAVIYLYYF